MVDQLKAFFGLDSVVRPVRQVGRPALSRDLGTSWRTGKPGDPSHPRAAA